MRAERGYLVAGRYELAGLIAVGGMGEVWRARDVVLDRLVAVKLLRAEHTGDAAFLARFRDEARHAASLSHPNIATVHDYGEQDGWAFLVMELVEGESLAARLARTGPAGPAAVVGVLGQVGDALAVAHRAGIVHRDVKPANILLTRDGRVKLTDFGIAKAIGASSHTASGVVVGTARYLSPEQATGAPTSPASDVYAMGLVAYEMLAGRPPFTGANDVAVALAHVRDLPPSLPADVPPSLATLVGESLAKDPARRPPDASAFTARLRAVDASPAGAPTRPVGPPVTPPGAGPAAISDREPEPTRIDPTRRGHGSGTAVAPAGFAASASASAAASGAGSGAGARAPSVLGDLPARHRSRRRRRVVAFTLVALLAVAGGGFLVARAVDDDDPAGASTANPGDSIVTTAVPPPTPTTMPATTTAGPTTTSTTTSTSTTSTTSTTTSTTSSTTTATPTTASTTLAFDPAQDDLDDLIGQDAGAVYGALDAAGIRYDVDEREARRKDQGKVLDVRADGQINEGGVVILVVGTEGKGEDD